MPTDPTLVQTIGSAAGQVIGNVANAWATTSTNKASRKWNERMWQLQNEYNHPSSQMARLREAKLNPNLVYGNGNSIQAAASPQSWKPDAPQFNVNPGDVMSRYFDAEVKQATVDNLRKQNTIMDSEKLLKDAQTIATLNSAANTVVQTQSGKFDLDLKNTLRTTSIEMARANLNKITADTTATIDANDRAAAMQASNLTQAVENILSARVNRETSTIMQDRIRQEIANLKKDGKLKDFDIKLTEKGVRPGDAPYWRYVGQIIESVMDKVRGNNKKDYTRPGITGDNFDSFGRPRN